MVSLLAQGAMDCGLELWSGKIGICCISAKNTDLRSKIKDWFAQKQDNVFVNRDMSILVSWRCKDPINRVGLVQSGYHHHHFIKLNLFSPWYSWKIAHLALKNKQWLTHKGIVFSDLMVHVRFTQYLSECLSWSGRFMLKYLNIHPVRKTWRFQRVNQK